MTSTISDETLTAFLDGELSDEERRNVEAAIAADPALAARLEALDIPVADIKTAFDALLKTAPAPVHGSAPRSRVSWSTRAAVAAVFAIGVLVGVWSPWLTRQADTDWKMAVANYQVLYVPETLAGKEPAPDQATEKLSQLSEKLGRDLESAITVEGLSYRRAQMLGLGSEPLVQIAYLSDGNEPFAICITPVDEPSYGPEAEMLAGLASAHWVDDGFGFLVIGGGDLNQVNSIASDLKGRI